MNKNILFAIFLSMTSVAHAQTSIDVYVFAGQSNMVGTLGNALPLPFTDPNPSVLSHYKTNQGAVPRQVNSSIALEPLGHQGTTGGPELSFAAELVERGASPFAIVKVAGIGVKLAGTGESWNPALVDSWYADLAAKTELTISDLTALNYVPTIAGIFWVQGETDASNETWANEYEANLTNFIATFRDDFQTNAPFYFNRLNANVNQAIYPYPAPVIAGQEAVASTVANARLLVTDDLELKVDMVHYANASTIEIGRRFADFIIPSADFNDDGTADSDDLLLWQDGDLSADSNSDNVVDGEDFLLWQRQFVPPAQLLSVPEPKTLLLCLTFLFFTPPRRT